MEGWVDGWREQGGGEAGENKLREREREKSQRRPSLIINK